jgi:hypothetical protein
MEVELAARVYALELLTTQLISELLRTVPDPIQQVTWGKGHLHHLADGLPVHTESLDEEARLRVRIKAHTERILDTALAQAQTAPLRPRPSEIRP